MGGGDAPEYTPIDPGVSAGQFLFGRSFRNSGGMTDPALQDRLIDAEARARPEYARLNLQDFERNLFGFPDQRGLLELQSEAGMESEAMRQRVTSAQREADIADVEALGARATSALRASDPEQERLLGQQRRLTDSLYGRAAGVTPEQRRIAEQTARAAGLARGRELDNSTVAAEILGREEFQRRNRQEAQQAGGQMFAMNQTTSADPFQAILGRPSQALPYGAQSTQQAIGLLGQNAPQLYNPDAGVNLAAQQNANAFNVAASNYSADQQRAAGMFSGLLGGVGSFLGGF